MDKATQGMRQVSGQHEDTPSSRRDFLRGYIFPAVLVLGLGIAAYLLVDVRTLLHLLLTAKLLPMLGVVVCHLLSMFLHGARFRILLDRTISVELAFHANAVCNLANSLLPFRAGEFAMAYLISRETKVGGGEVLSNVLVDRLLAILSILVIFLLSLPFFTPLDPFAEQVASKWRIYLIIFGALVAGIYWVTKLERQILEWARAVLMMAPFASQRTKERLLTRGADLICGLHVLFRPRLAVPVFLGATASWAAIIGLNYFSIVAVMDSPPVVGAIFVTFFTIIGLMIITTPAGVGAVHGASVLALSMFGIGAETALASAILGHTLVVLINVGVGLWSARQTHFAFMAFFSTKGSRARG